MTDHYLPSSRNALTLDTVDLERRGDTIIVTAHISGAQTVIACEEFAAAAVDGWCVNRLAMAQAAISYATDSAVEAVREVLREADSPLSYDAASAMQARIRERKP